ncbi:MAG TPA: helix-turn-helix transcriptional regulator [Lysobacter sp.]
MALDYHALHFAERLDLGRAPSDRLHLVHASGRGAQLELPAGWLSLWLPLRGALQVQSLLSHWSLPKAQLLVGRDGPLRGGTRTPAWWLALAGPMAAWNTLLQALPERPLASDVFPRQWTCPRELRRLLVRLARLARRPERDAERGPVVAALGAALLERQNELQPLLERSNGRTAQRRRQTLLRLLRVHQLIERDSEGRLDLAQLAQIASYSPWHLIRMYREVFGETPSEHAARLRLDRAWSLVCDSAMPVCEITEALGFESQSAFCRAFKNAYGLTTTQVRHLPPVLMRQAGAWASHARTRVRRAQTRTA